MKQKSHLVQLLGAEGTHLLSDSRLDTRSDEEIGASINKYIPITSTKNVWAYWNTGWDTMKPWTQRNVIGWVRRLGKDWTVRVLDRVEGSPNNVYNFLDKSYFPNAFNNSTMRGPYVGAHSADLVRLPCLYEHGGVWLDVSIMLFRTLEDICWNVLTDPESPFEFGGFVIPDCHKEHQIPYGYMENWFLATARKHNPFIKRWHSVFKHYWSDIEESKDAKEHPLFEHLNTKGFRQDMIDYLAQHLSYYRVRTLVDEEDSWDGPEYYRTKMYLLNARQEAYHLPHITSWQGEKCHSLLKQKVITRPTDNTPEESREADQVAKHMIANCSLMKSVHGFKGETQLSDIWNRPENVNADIDDGTYAELLRAASLFVEQERKLDRLVVDVESSQAEPCLKAQLLQPVRELRRLSGPGNCAMT